jgi:hypothetical protein
MPIFSLFLIFVLLPLATWAELDGPSIEALTKTQNILRDPQKREDAMDENPKYREGEKTTNQLVGGNSKQKQKIYEISAQVLEEIATRSNGDVPAMQDIITRAQQNPEKFMQEFFNEEQKAQVRELANEIEKEKKVVPPQQRPN